jgi:hypothetical protein
MADPADAVLTFELGPSFAPNDAARLHEALVGAPDVRVEIDFRRVRNCDASALAALAADLAAAGPRIAVRGLSQHQLRLLGYLAGPDGAKRWGMG